MYGITARLFTRRSCSYLINNHNFRIFRNFSVHNLKLSNEKFNNRTSFTTYTGISRTYRNNSIVRGSQEDVDKTLIALAAAYKEQGRIYAFNILNVLENSNLKLLKDDQDLLLLQCCGHAIADLTSQARAELCEKVWKKLEEYGVAFNIKHYNVYLQICIENRVQLDFQKFLAQMKCEPNKETYRLLLDSACEVGDVKQAVQIVAVMKNKKFPADERLFDSLVLGHSIKGGLNDAEKVLETMETAHIPLTPSTQFAVIRGLAWHKDCREFMHALRMFPGIVHEEELLKLLMALGLNGNYIWLREMMQILGFKELSKQSMQQLDLLCVHLIHSGQPEAAFAYYKSFAESVATQDEGMYAFFLLTEMLRSGTPPEVLINIAKDLQESGLNPVALEKLTGVALRNGNTETAWLLLETMPKLRCHYFWSLLLQMSQKQGEQGVLNISKRMLERNVKPDLDTLEYYTIPFCDSVDPQQLLYRLQNLGFTVRELLTPLLAFLLRQNRTESARQLCKVYENVPVDSERLLQPLSRAWNSSGDTKNIVKILQKMYQSHLISVDYAGQFLIRIFKINRPPVEQNQFLSLLEEMCINRLQISASAADSVLYRIKSLNWHGSVNITVREAIDSLVNASINQSYSHIPHPRDMNVTELENHLIELQNKNMETRGVLRRLIQEYSRLGNDHRVNELRQQFVDAGYEETAGMKSSLLYSYVNNGKTDGALNMYFEIKTHHPEFVLDDFKIIDLATLLVANGQFESAISIITSETANSKARGGPKILRNCWRLLSAAKDEMQVEKLFHLLVDRSYCVPTNVILGPLVKVHLKNGNLDRAVQIYAECAEKYKCTPLQMELLCAVVEDENEHLLQEVLNVTSKVHGSEAATVSLIAALAQNGLHKSLRKFLLELKVIPRRELEKRCQRWVNENKISALETLAQASYKLPSDILDQSFVYHCIMKIHSINNDCESAVAFYRRILEKEEVVPQKLVDELLRLVNRCKYKMPEVLKTRNAS